MTSRVEKLRHRAAAISAAFRELAKAQEVCDRWTEKRSKMQPGVDSRAKLSTVAARWASACEERDRREQALRDLGVEP